LAAWADELVAMAVRSVWETTVYVNPSAAIAAHARRARSSICGLMNEDLL
jgi:hypothetical protein